MNIKEVLIKRDGMLGDAADELIEEAKEQLTKYLTDGDIDLAERICEEYFGLEPDYLDELM